MARGQQRRRPSFDMYSAPRVPAKGGASRIRRFDGQSRIDSDWDKLRKDKELWSLDGNCLVHLHAPGASKRGPSFRIDLDVLQQSQSCLLEGVQRNVEHQLPSLLEDSTSNSDSSSPELYSFDAPYALFIPAPSDIDRKEAFTFHLRTRNYLAFLSGKSLVGELLSTTLIDLWERVQQWHLDTTVISTLLQYFEQQGYTSCANNATYALALLKFAEAASVSDLWISAFVHCVGMHDQLDLSPEYQGLSNTAKALITRATLEMDLHLGRVSRALGTFLQEELDAEHLGLSKPARDHLERFRSALHGFYVDKFGYFPPSERQPWGHLPWQEMFQDFQNLYEYLADKGDDEEASEKQSVYGGVCVLQNVRAFNQRHGYVSLPHSLPLLPKPQSRKQAYDTQKGIRNWLSRVNTTTSIQSMPARLLAEATNAVDASVLENDLVREYQYFESHRLDEKATLQEARKVRWLLIYGMLQMLSSIIRSPAEVQDVERAQYPLCVLTTGCPPWLRIRTEDPEQRTATPQQLAASASEADTTDSEERADTRMSIHPDCEAENAELYFTMSRQSSFTDMNMAPAPLRQALTRNSSLRSTVSSALQRSVVGSLSRKSSRKNSKASMHEPPPPQLPQAPRKSTSDKRQSYCQIVVKGYGNGLEDGNEEARRAALQDLHAQIPTTELKRSASTRRELDFHRASIVIEPIMEDFKADAIQKVDLQYPQLISSDLHRNVSDASAASTNVAPFTPTFDTEETERSETDASSVDNTSINESEPPTPCAELEGSPMEYTFAKIPKPASYVPTGAPPPKRSLNAGCYLPRTGSSVAVGQDRPAHTRTVSGTSATSSVHPDESEQATDTDYESPRGRSLQRPLEQLRNNSRFNFLE